MLAVGSASSQVKEERERERGREQAVRVAGVDIPPQLQNILKRHQLVSNFTHGAALFFCSCVLSQKKARVKVAPG